MATLTLGLSLAIAGLVVLINRMNKSKAEAMAKDAELHNQVVKTRIEIAQESAEIDKQFRALEKRRRVRKLTKRRRTRSSPATGNTCRACRPKYVLFKTLKAHIMP